MTDMISKMRDEMDRCLPDAVPHQTLEMVARAVLKLLREPSDEMLEAMKSNGAEGTLDALRLDFQYAIDAALGEQEE